MWLLLEGGALGFGVADDVVECLSADAYGVARQFGYVVALEEEDVVFRVALW